MFKWKNGEISKINKNSTNKKNFYKLKDITV